MSKKNNKKTAIKEVVEETAPEVEIVSTQTEPSRDDWDRKIVPTAGTPEAEAMDFERVGITAAVTGARYARIDERGRVMQVRIEGSHWWTVQDAVDAGVIPEDFDQWSGHLAEYDAKIARVEIMERCGLPVPDGVAVAYAQGVADKKLAIAKKEKKEAEIVAAGKVVYADKAKTSAEKRFDKISERVAARAK